MMQWHIIIARGEYNENAASIGGLQYTVIATVLMHPCCLTCIITARYHVLMLMPAHRETAHIITCCKQ